MTTRLPTPGGDDGNWGDILNAYLEVSLASDGTLNPGVVGNSQLDSSTQSIIASVASKYVKPSGGIPGSDIASGAVTSTQLDTPTNTALSKANSSVQTVNNNTPNGSGNVTLTATDVSAIPASQLGAANGVATLDVNSKLTASQLPGSAANISAATIVVAANGATDGTQFNAALASAAAAGGGRVSGIPGQTYVLDEAIVIPSNCILDLSGITVTRAAGLTGLTAYMIQNAASIPLRSVSDAVLAGGLLATAITYGAATTSLTLQAPGLSAAAPSGALVTLSTTTNPPTYQTFTLSAAAVAGATTLSVVSQNALQNFPIGTAAVTNSLTSATAAFTSTDVGRTVIVVNAGRVVPSIYSATTNLYTTIASVTNGTTVALTEAGCVSVSAAMLQIFGRDSNVGIIGDSETVINAGSIEYNRPEIIYLRRINNCVVKGGGATCNGGAAGGATFFSPGDITNFEWDDWTFATGYGGVQICGPMTNYSITNAKGSCGDDMVAAQGSGFGWDANNANDCQGPLTNGYIGSTFPDQTLANGIKIFGGLDNGGVNCPIRGLTIERTRGSVATTGINIESDRSGNTDIDGLVIRDTLVTSTTGYTCQPITLATSLGKNVMIDHVEWDGSSGTSGIRKAIILLNLGWESVKVKDVALDVGNYVDVVNVNGTGASIKHLVMEDINVQSSSSAALSNVGVISVLDLERIYGAALYSTGLITEIRASKVHVFTGATGQGSAPVALMNAGQGTTTKLRLAQADFSGTLTYAIETEVPLTVQLAETTFAHTGVAIEVAAAVAVRVESGETVEWNQTGAALAGSGTWSADGNLPINIASLTPANGDKTVNTAGSLQAPIGPAIYSAAAGAWTSMFQAPVYTSITPSSLTSLIAWWKADAITGLTDGQAVSSWVDSSPSSNALAQATGADQPIYKASIQNGLPIVRFNGSSDVMVAGASSAAVKQLIVVAKYSAAAFSNYNGLVTGNVSAANQEMLVGTLSSTSMQDPALGSEIFYRDGVGMLPSSTSAGPMNAFAILAFSTTGWANPMTLMVGQDRGLASRYWNGDIAEICVFNAVLTTAQLAGVLLYLQAKWATPAFVT